jgi:hypothetical protein
VGCLLLARAIEALVEGPKTVNEFNDLTGRIGDGFDVKGPEMFIIIGDPAELIERPASHSAAP